jgi:hypothetical protein
MTKLAENNPQGTANIADDRVLPAVYFGYGGMKRGQNTKLHIITNDCKVLCGTHSHWMEATEDVINNEGYLENKKHLFPITDKRSNTCKKCLKAWLSLNGR